MSTKDELLALSDHVWQRTSSRLRGMDDDEYYWEPVGMLDDQRPRDGSYRAERGWPDPEPAPFTTLAGRFTGGTAAGFVLHMLDEFIHHGAELGTLRDLYRASAVADSVGRDA